MTGSTISSPSATSGNGPSPIGTTRVPRAPCFRSRRRAAVARRRGFTLVELLVTMVILAILAALSAVGLAGVRTRARVAKTRSTIRKLHDAVVPRYVAYLDRRVDDSMWHAFDHEIERSKLGIAAGTPLLAAWKRLVQIRGMLVHEMPDQWGDVRHPVYPVDPADPTRSAGATGTPVTERYLRFVDSMVDRRDPSRNTREAVLAGLGRSGSSAETLHLLVALGSFDTDALESFREDEIGDVDGDGAREFLDGFARPIHFIRWAPGAGRAAGVTGGGDPFDPFGLGGPGTFPLTPLIVSAGPDERFGLRRDATHPLEEQGAPRTAARPGGVAFVAVPYDPFTPPEAGMPDPRDRSHADNITNQGMGQP